MRAAAAAKAAAASAAAQDAVLDAAREEVRRLERALGAEREARPPPAWQAAFVSRPSGRAAFAAARPISTGRGTRRVRLVRGEGRGVSD
jgi:cob(I)alamin adenosyltransferase